MPLKPGKSQKVVGHNIHEMVAAGHSQKQAVAASLHNADKYADGGMVDEDHENLMDHVAMEGIHAFHNKDHGAMRDALHVLMAHSLSKMMEPEEE